MPHGHWYEVVTDDSLRQGDIFRDIEAYTLPDDLNAGQAEIEVERSRQRTWIVAIASCDMQARGFTQILLVPVLPADRKTLKFFKESTPEEDFLKRLEVINRGGYNRRFLLPPHPDPSISFPLSVVAWDTVVVLPTAYLKRACTTPRLRLRSPLREKFGNWLGARISAVGPEDETRIPPFWERVGDSESLDAGDAHDEGASRS